MRYAPKMTDQARLSKPSYWNTTDMRPRMVVAKRTDNLAALFAVTFAIAFAALAFFA